mmetsp:Transcript_37158/g.82656  ORF Transcript_37158/g.82656 Transcript_37158/m.82656 type:complete len:230 (+) Transcript_37158:493-1182(+)
MAGSAPPTAAAVPAGACPPPVPGAGSSTAGNGACWDMLLLLTTCKLPVRMVLLLLWLLWWLLAVAIAAPVAAPPTVLPPPCTACTASPSCGTLLSNEVLEVTRYACRAAVPELVMVLRAWLPLWWACMPCCCWWWLVAVRCLGDVGGPWELTEVLVTLPESEEPEADTPGCCCRLPGRDAAGVTCALRELRGAGSGPPLPAPACPDPPLPAPARVASKLRGVLVRVLML